MGVSIWAPHEADSPEMMHPTGYSPSVMGQSYTNNTIVTPSERMSHFLKALWWKCHSRNSENLLLTKTDHLKCSLFHLNILLGPECIRQSEGVSILQSLIHIWRICINILNIVSQIRVTELQSYFHTESFTLFLQPLAIIYILYI